MKNFLLGALATLTVIIIIGFAFNIIKIKDPSTTEEIAKEEIAEIEEAEIEEAEDPQEEVPSNIYSYKGLQIGDQVGELTVEEIGYIVDREDSPNEFNNLITFSGELTLSGEYEYLPTDAGPIAGPCFWPDEESQEDIPTIDWGHSKKIFCFDNELAEAEFGPAGSKGESQIIIQNYRSHNLEAAITDLAKLVEVIKN